MFLILFLLPVCCGIRAVTVSFYGALFIAFAKELMFSSALLCLFVC